MAIATASQSNGTLPGLPEIHKSCRSKVAFPEKGVSRENNFEGIIGRPFIKVNCAAIPAGLIENELFGHERGAFTGAVGRRTGRFEMAHGGTLFLDEIGDIPLELQPKLLRVLPEQEFERVGGSVTMRTDVRIVAATSRNLLHMVSTREFRADLYYRLNVFPISVPALRERSEDILLLARHFEAVVHPS